MRSLPIKNITRPTTKQMSQLRQSVKKAAKGSYDKQMQVLRNYPNELKKALELVQK